MKVLNGIVGASPHGGADALSLSLRRVSSARGLLRVAKQTMGLCPLDPHEGARPFEPILK